VGLRAVGGWPQRTCLLPGFEPLGSRFRTTTKMPVNPDPNFKEFAWAFSLASGSCFGRPREAGTAARIRIRASSRIDRRVGAAGYTCRDCGLRLAVQIAQSAAVLVTSTSSMVAGAVDGGTLAATAIFRF